MFMMGRSNRSRFLLPTVCCLRVTYVLPTPTREDIPRQFSITDLPYNMKKYRSIEKLRYFFCSNSAIYASIG